MRHATGDDPEARRRRTAAWDTDYSGPRGADRRLEPIFEADFDPDAYGYRPKRGAQDAIQKVGELLRSGYTDVVDADLSKYFDTIPHQELMRCVARRKRGAATMQTKVSEHSTA